MWWIDVREYLKGWHRRFCCFYYQRKGGFVICRCSYFATVKDPFVPTAATAFARDRVVVLIMLLMSVLHEKLVAFIRCDPM